MIISRYNNQLNIINLLLSLNPYYKNVWHGLLVKNPQLQRRSSDWYLVVEVNSEKSELGQNRKGLFAIRRPFLLPKFCVQERLLYKNMNKTRASKINQSINDKTYFKNISKMLMSSSYKIDEVIKVVTRHNKLIKKLSEDTKWIHDNQKIRK